MRRLKEGQIDLTMMMVMRVVINITAAALQGRLVSARGDVMVDGGK